jgi:hypothetical protein
VGLVRSAIAAAALLGFTAPGGAAEFACLPDQCIERINEIVRKTNEGLVAAKVNCEQQGGSERCIYRGSAGPNLHVIFGSGSPNVQVILIADARGLSPAGGAYIGAIMEAFDTSLDAQARMQFYDKLLDQSAGSLQNGGQAQMSSAKFSYALYTNERLTIIAISAN